MRGGGLYALDSLGVDNLSGQASRRPYSQLSPTSAGTTCASMEGFATDADADGLPADQSTNYDCDVNSGGTVLRIKGSVHLHDAGDTVAFNGGSVEINNLRYSNGNGSYWVGGSSTIAASGLVFSNTTDIEIQADTALRSLFFSTTTVAFSADALVAGYYGDSQLTFTSTPTSLGTMAGSLTSLVGWARFRRGVLDKVLQLTASPGVTFNAVACTNTTGANNGYWQDGTFTFQDAAANRVTVTYTACTPTYSWVSAATGAATPFSFTP